ncbi:MAG: S8 family serine peptidase [Patescibacteria group bacterium]|nr:S8 family serine peptidase [Patescibacteria group bacterium]
MAKKIVRFFVYYLFLVLIGGFCFFHDSSAGESGQSNGKNINIAASAKQDGNNEILVKYKSSAEPAAVKVPVGVKLDDFLSFYQKKSDVEYAEPNYVYHASVIPSDPNYSKQWYLERIRAPLAWDRIRETPNVVIAVIDTGVQINHPDLAANIWKNSGEIPGNGIDDDHNGFIDDYNGWDFVNNVPDPSPKFEDGLTEAGVMHGTIVAGIIAAVGNNGKGISGITWQAKIMPLKVLDDKGEGRTSDVVRAIDYAINNKAAIINLSFVGLDYSRALYEAITRAYNAGVIVVAAAGNEESQGQGYNLDETPMYPACDDGENNMVIGVAATDAIDQKAVFSSYGSRCVDLAAPGVGFFSTAVYAPTQQINNTALDQYYSGYWSGTSMATPVVVGVLALLEGINPGAKAGEIKDILLATADDISRLNPAYQGKLGRGRVNALSAVALADREKQNQSVKLLLAPASGDSAEVREVQPDNTLIKKFNANPSGGIYLASGDVDGDNKVEIIAGPASGVAGRVKIFNTEGKFKSQFYAYAANYRGGVKVATGDFDGDGKDEIITAAGSGLKSDVKIFDNQGRLKNQFTAYDAKFLGGVNIAAGDVDGDGKTEIVTGPGSGYPPQVKIFSAKGIVKSQFLAYDKNFHGGVNVTVADLYGGAANHQEEIVTAPGKGGGPHIRIFDGKGKLQGQFFAYDRSWHGGVNIASGDTNGDSLAEIITGAGAGGGPHVRVFDPSGIILQSYYAFDPAFAGGVNVGTASIKN